MNKPKSNGGLQVLIATSNQGKFKEMMEVLGGLPLQFLSLVDVGIAGDFEETADTFEGNALAKASALRG